ncbi:MAG: alpha-amlyase [Leeuwenhoekiella sp.]|uniref:Alpha-amlyase n=1 Tax=Leeuwenhoekiella nanhaiensis TaxID=1655491 RepID=A0A2G1VWJ1_9FLAO|nr:glycoside hydrolase family 13 protein [Leeuwenhoekiella nanhaiensis]PHQ30980.1 alpha-amlyase [Leeuwenhoekiella nanhaiensis]PHR89969.1 MAG: alpha-amlyase [Leeuwenhoekiella sp.]
MIKTIKNLFLLACFCLLGFSGNAQLKKVEPPYWWAGMEKSEIQILFYGKDIADYKVSLQEDVPITGIRKTENPNYLFVSIETAQASAGILHFDFSKKGKVKFTRDYELKERTADSKNREGYDSSDVMYLLMPDRFANGNPDNDSVDGLTDTYNREKNGGRHGGDIKGIVDHLDYLEELGVTTLWSTPLLEDNDPGYSYHTYAQSDVYKIDPRYGSNEDYKNLASELHKRDMKLVMDYVTNHWGAEHWMVKDLPTYDFINQFPGYAQSNYRMETQFDPHAAHRDHHYCADGWFVKTMPDLNQKNPLVLNYLIQNAIWWIEYADLDGLRVDTYSYNDKEGISKWTKAIMDEYPNFNIVGEVWLHDQAQIAYWQKDSKIGAIQNYNTYLPSVMDFTLHDGLTSMFSEKGGWDTGMKKAYNNFVNDFLYPDTNNLLVFLENHDTGRFNEIYDQDINAYKLGLTLIATTRGIPQLYYGSEIGMRGDKAKGDGDIRRDFPGGWEGDALNAFKASVRTEQQNQFYDFTQKLLNWRKSAKAIHSGILTQYIPENNVYVFFRSLNDAQVMVVLNNNDEVQTLDLSRFSESIKSSTAGVEVLSGKQIALKQTLTVPAKTPMIIELN